MTGSFETDETHADASLRPIRVPTRREEIFGEAKEMVADLSSWTLESSDPGAGVLVCNREGGLLRGAARITITVDGPEGIPSATVTVRSETGAGIARDRANVQEFTKPFHRRVC